MMQAANMLAGYADIISNMPHCSMQASQEMMTQETLWRKMTKVVGADKEPTKLVTENHVDVVYLTNGQSC